MSEKKIRRLAAIMFTDIAGYTRLMQESEARAAEIRSRHREVFRYYHDQFNGQILQYYGDGTLSIFDSCVDATRCAILMQKDLQKDPVVPLRIGIHLGDIVKDQEDIYGDGVNIAARIESLGVPGAVLLSGEVHKQLGNQEIETISMGQFTLKNVATPVEVFAVRADGLLLPKGRDLRGKAKRLNSTFSAIVKTDKWIRFSALGFLIMALGATLFWTLTREQIDSERSDKLPVEERIKWAYQTGIPKIEELTEKLSSAHNIAGIGPEAWEAYALVKKLEEVIPNDSKLEELKNKCSLEITLNSKPVGAKIYAKPYLQPDSAFQLMGVAPLKRSRFPSGNISIRIEKDGYETIEDFIYVSHYFDHSWEYVLEKKGTVPSGMSMVRPHIDTSLLDFLRLRRIIEEPDEFLVDNYEVSNQEYKMFVEKGGYQNPQYWKEPFIKGGKEISWQDAMKFFVDNTGRPGPQTWEAGDYPAGKANHPVSGVSWYEACAYAEFAGKQLPSMFHLKYLSGSWAIREVALKSNLKSKATTSRKQNDPQNHWGVYDVFGNVREWCYNKTNRGLRSIVGGAYDDQEYLANDFSSARSSFDRSISNGFRCIKYQNSEKYDRPLYRDVLREWNRDYYQENPVADEIFDAYLSQFRYDKENLNPKLISQKEEKDWTKEKVEFIAPSGKEKMPAYLFLPKNIRPPYQVVLYWPGWAATWYDSSEDFLEMGQVDFLIKNGRAVMMPIYWGTYERKDLWNNDCRDWKVCWKNNHLEVIKEVQKSIDYLETRADIDLNKIALYGLSWGAAEAPIAVAIDKRIDLAILALGGLRNGKRLDEVDVFNYLPQIKVPTLLINGRYDFMFPLKESIRPFFDYLGTPVKDKSLKLYNDGHSVPRNELIKESLSFLDKYFGAVEYRSFE